MNWTYWAGWSWFRGVAKASFNYEVVGRERLIEEGGALVVSNHVSFLDPPLVGIAHRKGVFYLARKTLFKGFTAWLYPRWNSIPIDQENPDMSSLKNIIKLLKSGERVVMFPEGERSWDGQLLPAKAGVGLIVSKARVPVLPVRLFGAHEALPRGASFWKNRQVTLVVGEPIEFTEEELKGKGREAYQAIADKVIAAIAAIELPERR
ncbi:1-acyl-sn-glycerol-3-phosphate acyltransferase [Roseibacillus ishigakijimensis]|uniref:1-acyl-sn-glycerol-3-phosphate acyltransferase n=2 Tax=Roseibacillus ishigakijimensis TaxID=454146 RepID=A0A934RR06_9BACT|nr:1-acyl-sn-glycerol-3-phosphate acyltransferase [Roseibacillus ishigakijimensis]